MARLPRGDVEGGIYHLYPRGVNRCTIFADDRDRFFFMKTLVRVARDGYFGVIAFCLMGNHLHLVVERFDLPLGDGMNRLLGTYAPYFNRRHRRSGHLFQNRFGSQLCDSDSYLVHLIRYTHRNPVRAGLVPEEAAHAYSSYCWYARSRWPRWADPGVARAVFGCDAAVRKFFVGTDEGADRREIDAHEERMAARRARANRIVLPRKRTAAQELHELEALQNTIELVRRLGPGELWGNRPKLHLAEARREFVRAAVLLGGVRKAHVARFLGISGGRVSQLVASKK